jgi:hypothetical protein
MIYGDLQSNEYGMLSNVVTTLILIVTLLLSSCASFDQQAIDARKKARYAGAAGLAGVMIKEYCLLSTESRAQYDVTLTVNTSPNEIQITCKKKQK